MKDVGSQVRVHRILGCLAVAHAGLLLFVPSTLGDGWMSWTLRLWVGLATLWFLWPLVLALHPAQSARRVLIPLGFAAPFVFLWFRLYSSDLGPPVFGLPEFVHLTPHSMLQYAISYRTGWADANKKAKTAGLSLEAYGFGTFTPGAPGFSRETLKQCGIEINHVAGCVVDTQIVGHANGYNIAMIAEIKRRFGNGVVKAAEDKDAKWPPIVL
jgi:hypothetical protein